MFKRNRHLHRKVVLMKWSVALVTAFLLGAVFGRVLPGGSTPDPEIVVKPGPTPPWIEVTIDGELTSEWQPADGAIYQHLKRLIDARW